MPAPLVRRTPNALLNEWTPPDEAPPGSEDAETHQEEGGESDDADQRPWTAPGFSPYPTRTAGAYFHEGGVTFKHKKDGAEHVCDFVAEPVGQVVTLLDLDHLERRERRLEVRFTLPNGQQQTLLLDPADSRGELASALLRAVPSDLARASVATRRDVARAASAFKSPRFTTTITVRQCGWLPTGEFARPGDGTVDLVHVDGLPGARLWDVPSAFDRDAVVEGARALLTICESAHVDVIAPVVATVFAAPIFRSETYLAARGFATLVVGPSQRGKTTLVRTVCCLLGRFDQQPGCVATWDATPAAIEQALHAYRDLPVFIDDFRETDGNARETFRRVVLALADGSGRSRTWAAASGARTANAFQPVGLLLATGEQSVDDDAAIAGRVIEVSADNIKIARLLGIAADQCQGMPHLYAAYLTFVSRLPPSYWSAKREATRALALELGSTESRAGENLATLAVTLDVATDFFHAAFGDKSEIFESWQYFVRIFRLGLPALMSRHATRIREGGDDEVVLREVARGFLAKEIRLARLPSSKPPPDAKGKLVGAYDTENIYLMPDILTSWVSNQLLRAKRRCHALGRKTLGRAFARRAAVDEGSLRKQLTVEGKVTGVWPVPRAGLNDAWVGLLDDAQ